ncbi:MAG: sigma-70 family RNA polymerase sigma factor [Planctomycetota bacterium]|jgi:RNA polymerase sigma factor for flagellar operon FliA|nr:sigma-70 family RNA polymerase sigma factor [Planctomycetota bacterium]
MKQTTTNKYEAQIEQWTDLVWHIVNKIKGRLPFSVSEEELYAAGMFGLMRAARSYDESQGAQFKTYAYHRVRGAILDDLRRMDFLPRSVRDRAKESGEDAPSIVALPTDEDGHIGIGAQETSDSVEESEMLTQMHAAIDRLPEKMQAVMSMYYRQNMKMCEIGLRLNITESRVSQIHTNAVTRLRRMLNSSQA